MACCPISLRLNLPTICLLQSEGALGPSSEAETEAVGARAYPLQCAREAEADIHRCRTLHHRESYDARVSVHDVRSERSLAALLK